MAEQKVMMFELSEIAFKHERATAIADVLEMLLAEGPVEIRGLPEHAVQDTLFQIKNFSWKNRIDNKSTCQTMGVLFVIRKVLTMKKQGKRTG